ncbi:MAG: hypothetical protein ACREDD_07805 [Methylocella sp.]
MRCIAICAALVAIAIPTARAAPPVLSPTREFEGSTTIAARNGTMESIHVSVEMWRIVGERGPKGPTYEIPLRGFYVAHLANGEMWTTIGGQTTRRTTGDYWTVKPGGAMQVRVLGELALLETTVVAKQ